MPTLPVPQAFAVALQHHQTGRWADAEALYHQILDVQPDHAEALHYLGVLAHQTGKPDLAMERIRRAIAIVPNYAAAHCNLGEAYRSVGRTDEAVASFRRALQLQPDLAEAHNNLGNVLREQGQLDAAVAACRRALELRPDYAEASNNLGSALMDLGQLDSAAAACRRALELQPHFPGACNNLGTILFRRGQFDAAVAAYQQALRLQPDFAEAYHNLGVALSSRGRTEEALAAYRRAFQLRPELPGLCNNMGIALAERGCFEEAIATYREAIRLDPRHAEAHSNLGIALARQGQLDEAVATYRRAIELRPDLAEAHNNLGNAFKDQGLLDEAIASSRRALDLQPGNAVIHSNLICTLHFLPGGERAVESEQKRWARKFDGPAKRFVLPLDCDRSPHRRLRVGYVSSDFRQHSVGYNVLPLFEQHDCEQFEVLCYSAAIRADAMTERFQALAGTWRDVGAISDGRLARMIHDDRIDILVDLGQHTAGNRLSVFAHRPAPVQVSFAGYPASAGLELIPFRISDRYLEAEATGSDGRVHSIDSFWCFDPAGAQVEINELPARENGWATFGCLNNFCKVNEPMLNLWASVLAEAKDSRLILLSFAGSHQQRTLEILRRKGIEGHRVEFVAPRARQAYLELYRRLDIVLDSFPYNGHTTSLEALWMGVPVVSLVGRTAVSRAGLSQLSNVGLPELAAFSESDFVSIATLLARDLVRLAELRNTLRSRMQASLLMDATHFTRSIEAAYRTMWRQWCATHSCPSP